MFPTLDEAKALAAQGYRRIPVSREIYADRFTPTEVMRTLKHVSRHCYMLESAEDARQWGRYTFLGFDPSAELTCKGGQLRIRAGAEFTEQVTHPGDAIRHLLDENRSPKLAGLPPFTGGLVGYFSYSYIGYAEPTLHLTHEDGAFQDVDLMLFDKVIAFDNLRQ
ncbi:MAG: anthranilate synthase component I, partial [Butyricicoccus sp.]|nr:anthranilate synthase component I [Butyricicoccus sp.]